MAREVAAAVKSAVEKAVLGPDAGSEVYVGADGQPTFRIDDIAEKAAFYVLEGRSAAVLSEEAGLVMFEEKPEFLCVLDPLDGSSNAVRGVPFYCTSVAFAPWSAAAALDDVCIGVVQNLVTGDIFEAKRGEGARLNGKPIRTSPEAALENVTASLYLKSGYSLIPVFGKVRAMGAVALELAHTAAGGLNLLLDNRDYLKVTDVAAGKLLVEEAGGTVTDLKGNNLNQSITRLERVSIVAAGNPMLHSRVISEASR